MKTLRLLAALLITAILIAACSAAVEPGAAGEEPGPRPTLADQPASSNPDLPVPINPDEPVSSEPGNAEPGPGEPMTPAEYAPQPGDSKLSRGNVYLESIDLLTLESFPPQFMLSLEGSLPNPCYALRVVVSAPDAQNKIAVDVYSVFDPNLMCAEVIKPFAQGVALGQLKPGLYTVLVNGDEVGQIEMPQY